VNILVINPNSDARMTRAIGRTAERFAAGAYRTECLAAPGAPRFIETYEDEMRTAPGMLKLVREGERRFNAFVVACHCDPNLDLLKEATAKPVVGIGEASMKLASMLGHAFSVISATAGSIPNKLALVRAYGLESACASVRAAADGDYLRAARLALRRDGAEVIVLGCAGMTGWDGKLRKALGVPVLDPVVCGLIVASGLAACGAGISKVRRYGAGG
jgi:allantoin racemase